jgi:hypothetical protein
MILARARHRASSPSDRCRPEHCRGLSGVELGVNLTWKARFMGASRVKSVASRLRQATTIFLTPLALSSFATRSR